MTPQDAFFRYHALKLHFTTDNYNFHKFNGKTNATDAGFKKRPDRFAFELAAKRMNLETWTDVIVAGFKADETMPYPKRCIDPDMIEAGEEWAERKPNLLGFFRTELLMLAKRSNYDLDRLLRMNHRDGHPDCLRYYYMHLVSPETLILLDRAIGFFPDWNKLLPDFRIWQKTHRALTKLSGFVPASTDETTFVVFDIFNIDKKKAS